MVDPGVVEDELIIDWDNLLDNLPDDLGFDLGDLPPAEGLTTAPDSGGSFSIDEIENYLLNCEAAEEKDCLADEFISDVLLECLTGSESEPIKDSLDSDAVKKSSASPELVEAVTDEEEKEREKPPENGEDFRHTMEDFTADDDDDGVADASDPNVRKRKRQMRNRDAAVRSRERKKMYVRDLEIKSKYYEAECKRLGNVLQCRFAENQALRFSLHNGQAFDASRTKQESAVLFLESLLLGSLLGFLGIIYLLILPSHLLSNLEASLRRKRDKSVARRRAGHESFSSLFQSFMMGKRCKASRSRMKLSPFSNTQVHPFLSLSLSLSHALLVDEFSN